MSKIKEICPVCGQPLPKEYSHNFNQLLLQDLQYLNDIGGSATLKAISETYPDMTKSEYNNFQKLRHFGLVTNTNRVYDLTDAGKAFLAGTGTCPRYVKTVKNKVTEKGPEMYISDCLSPVQKREDWEAQASQS